MTETETDFRAWLETQPQYRALLKPISTRDRVLEVMGAGGAALGAGAQSAAHNRGVQFDADLERARLTQQAERDFYDHVIRREQSGRDGQKHAWQMSNRAAYVAGATGKAPGFAGKYSRDIQAPSADQKRTADIVRQEMQRQLADGNQIPMPRRVGHDVQVRQPGAGERIAGIAGPVAGIASRVPPSVWRRIGKWIS